MSKHLPRFYSNTYCLWIDEGTAGWGGGVEEEEASEKDERGHGKGKEQGEK